MSKTVLLTGGRGFLGQHLQSALRPRQVLAPSSSELDLLDRNAVVQFLDRHAVDEIVHAAGFVGGIGRNKAHPGRMVADNLRMGANLVETASERKIHTLIVSTVCVYPAEAPVPTPETAMYEGYPAADTAFYGIAKRTLHTLAEGLQREFGSSYVYIIPTNLYGPGDYFDEAKSHVVPALLRRTIEAKEAGLSEIVVWGDGTATRDLLYVEDAAAGMVSALDDRAKNQVLNLGSGIETSIRELAETICEVVAYPGNLIFDASKPGGAPRRALDATRASELLDFRPRISLREGLQNTFSWYMQNRQQ